MSADDVLQKILAETKRRKKLWKQLEAMAKDAVAVVSKQAKQRGVKGKNWITSSRNGDVWVTFRLAQNEHTIFLNKSGRISVSIAVFEAERLYDGLPNLTDEAPKVFLQAAVEALLMALNDYCDEQKQSKL